MSDWIDRQEAIDALDKEYRCTDRSDDWDGLKTAMLIVENLPSAQSTMGQQNDGDTISRKAAIDYFVNGVSFPDEDGHPIEDSDELRKIWTKCFDGIPSAQPDIIRCRNCKFASGDSRICMKFGHSPIGELDFCAWAERRTDG